MEIWEVLLIGVALSMDAVAVGMTDGMAEPRMRPLKLLSVAALFGGMQCLMPILGYYGGSVFTAFVEKIAPYLSFALLAFIGGKSVVGFFLSRRRGEPVKPAPAGVGRLLVQSLATSLDALAVGITFLAIETSNGLPMSAIWCSVVIGVITFSLVVPAVLVGKRAGDRFSDKAELAGGIVLLCIGAKILIESFF